MRQHAECLCGWPQAEPSVLCELLRFMQCLHPRPRDTRDQAPPGGLRHSETVGILLVRVVLVPGVLMTAQQCHGPAAFSRRRSAARSQSHAISTPSSPRASPSLLQPDASCRTWTSGRPARAVLSHVGPAAISRRKPGWFIPGFTGLRNSPVAVELQQASQRLIGAAVVEEDCICRLSAVVTLLRSAGRYRHHTWHHSFPEHVSPTQSFYPHSLTGTTPHLLQQDR